MSSANANQAWNTNTASEESVIETRCFLSKGKDIKRSGAHEQSNKEDKEKQSPACRVLKREWNHKTDNVFFTTHLHTLS